MIELRADGEFFNPTDTLECGQVFRYKKIDGELCARFANIAANNDANNAVNSAENYAGYNAENDFENGGYIVFSGDKACFVYKKGGYTREKKETVIVCDDENAEYFYNYFDLFRDYRKIYDRAINVGAEILKKAAEAGKGVRILNQDKTEAVLSFIISQNNNIPRIQKSIEALCAAAGEKRNFMGIDYYSFPQIAALADKTPEFYKGLGFGYRDLYMCEAVREISGGFFEKTKGQSGETLKKSLLSIKGIGEKVADCALLFGFHDTKSFPVDVWIEKTYKQDFKGELNDRRKISEYFSSRFGEDSGYFQQYLFYYKRSIENKKAE